MDLLSSTTDSSLSTSNTLVFGDNASELLNAGVLNIHPRAIITVNSIADVVDNNDGVTTLREAINQANVDSGEDLIVFERSLFSSAQTITLSLGELDITRSLGIIAPRDTLSGGDLVTLSGNNATRVFEIEPDATVNLSGLIISDGMVNADNGGGIRNFGTLNLDSSIVRGNNAINNLPDPSNPSPAEGGDGGGIYNAGTLNLTNSTLNNNTASYNTSFSAFSGSGGAIYNTGSVLISNSTLTGNAARGGFSSVNSGGSIYNSRNGNLLLRDSTISNSVSDANGIGGAIYNTGTADVTNSSVNGMVTGAFNAYGGAIYNGGTINLSYTSISGSSDSRTAGGIGGGIYNGSNLTLSNSTVSNSSASGGIGGGGIYNAGNAIATISNSTISNNTNLRGGRFGETSGGAGIYNLGTLRVSDSTITANRTLPGLFTGGNGGGIYNGGSSTITNSTISGNTASGSSIGGGGISNSGNITLTNSTISGNTALLDNTGFEVSGGGGIYNSGSSIITNSTISGNTASTSNDNAFSSSGGGIYNSGTLGLLFDTIAFNQASNDGGVANNTGSSTSVRNTIIAANTATGTNSVNPDVFGNFTSSGYNLIGNATGSTGFDPALGDIIGSSDSPIDPLLGSLSNNGGSTQTIALLPGSPAIGAADPIILDTDPITDQRGLPRRAANGSADIGAFQFTL